MTLPSFGADRAAFLRRLGQALGPLPPSERAAITLEIEAHIAERLAASPLEGAAVLAGLGDPVALGRAFVAQHRAGRAPAADRLGAAMNHAACTAPRVAALGLSGTGAAALALFALGFALTAVAKPFWPSHVGLWTGANGVSFGLLAHPGAPGAERLGPWITPVAAAFAAACALAAAALTRAVRRDAAG